MSRVSPGARVRARRAAYEPAGVESRAALAGAVLTRILAARLAADLVTIAGAHALALALRFQFGVLSLTERQGGLGGHIQAAGFSAAALAVVIAINRLYDEDTLFHGGGEFGRVWKAIFQAVVIFSALALLTRGFFLSRGWFGLAMLLSGLFLSAERLAFRSILQRRRARGDFRRPIIFVTSKPDSNGDGWSGDEFEIIDRVEPAAAIELLSRIAEARRESGGGGVPGVVMPAGEVADDDMWRILLHAGEARCPVYIQSPVRSVARDRLTVRPIGGRTIVKVLPPALTGFQAAQKRVLDVAVSGVVLLLASPVYLALSLAVLITSGRPIFYGQERVGRNGHAFKMWKFRTMRPDAEAKSGPVWAAENDPRRTPLGSFLRKTSLDEIPQFWNVFAGQMSLVGPRPERPVFVNEFQETIAWYPYRHRMRPGITGWAQANGLRGNTSLDDRVEYDNWYIEHWSIALDVKICLMTVGEIFRQRNAY